MDVVDEPTPDRAGRVGLQGESTQFDVPASDAGRLDVFISYARRPSDREFVDWLADRLTERGKTVWLDRSSVEPGADWRERIDRGIDAATSVIAVITPDSARSSECVREIEAAANGRKRIVPVVLRGVPPAELPAALTRLNWIDCQDVENYEPALVEVLEALDSDLEWRDAHARLTTKAHEWAGSRRDRSFLLRGRDLRAAEDWYGEKDQHKEQPTDEQYRFIAASRRSATGRQRNVLVAVAVGLVVSLGAVALAFVQRQNAIAQRRAAITQRRAAIREAGRSQSEQMALQAQTLFPTNTPAGILVALAAYERSPTPQARSALAQAATTRLLGILSVPAVGAFAYSPDGGLFATSDGRGIVSVWDAATHRRVRSWNEQTNWNGLVFSPDGKKLATADLNGRVVVRSIRGGATKTVLNAGALVDSLAFSPDGKLLATGTWAPKGTNYGLVALWDLDTGTRIWEHTALNLNVASEAFSPDGTILASGDSGNHVILWSVARGTKESVWDDGNAVWSLAFSPDGRTLATGTNGGGVVLWHVATATQKVLDSGTDVTWVTFSPDGRLLATGDYGGNVTLWSLPSGVKTARVNDGGQIVQPVEFSPDGKTLASVAEKQGTIAFWDESLIDDRGITAPPPSFSPDGRLLATGDSRGLTLWNLATGAAAARLSDASGITALAISPGGRSIALADKTGHLSLWNTVTHQHVTIGDDPAVLTLRFSPDGKVLAEGNAKGRVMLWDVATHRKRYWDGPGEVYDLAFSPDSRTIAIPWANGIPSTRLTLARVTTGKTERRWNWPSQVNQVAFTPDGRALAVGDQGGLVTLLTVKNGSTTARWNDGNIVNALALSPDGRTLAIGDATGDVTLWDLTSGARATTNTGGAPSVAFSPDGRRLAVSIGSINTGAVADVLYPTAFWQGSWTTIKALLCGELNGFNLTREQWASYSADGSYQRPCR